MGIHVDFTGVEATQGAGPIPEGEYLCMIDAAEETTSQSGTPGMKVTLKVVGGEFDGRLAWDRIWFTDKAMGVAKWKLQCAGVPLQNGPFTLEARSLLGRRVRIVVKHEEYQGKFNAVVKSWDTADQAPDPSGFSAPASGGASTSEIPF